MFEYENFNNKILKKVFKDLANKGWAALPDDKYDRVRAMRYSCCQYCLAAFMHVHILELSISSLLKSVQAACF